MSVYIVYRSTSDDGYDYWTSRWGAYLSLDSARSAILNHSSNRWEFCRESWFYEEYELDLCIEEDGKVERKRLFEDENMEDSNKMDEGNK